MALNKARGFFGEWTRVREWGRIGSPGRVQRDWFATFEDARRALDKKEQEKLKRGYRARAYFTASR